MGEYQLCVCVWGGGGGGGGGRASKVCMMYIFYSSVIPASLSHHVLVERTDVKIGPEQGVRITSIQSALNIGEC